MKLKQLIYAFLFNSILIATSGCLKEDIASDFPSKSGETARISIHAQLDPIIMTDTAIADPKIASPIESTTYQGMILQFDAAGQFLNHTPTAAIEIDLNKQFTIPEFELQQGDNQTLILIIAPDANTLVNYKIPSTLKNFDNSTINWSGIADTDQLPLIGKLTNISVSRYGITSTDGSTLFRLRRLGCRIDFSYSFSVAGYTLERITLHNLPKAMAVTQGTASYPAISSSEQLTQKVITPVATSGAFRWFIPANARGVGRNSSGDAKQKIATNAPDGFCTYLQIECTSIKNGSRSITWLQKVFLGMLYPQR